MQEGENKFRQSGKRQLGHEGSETKLDNADGKRERRRKTAARDVGGSQMRSKNDGAV